MKNLCEEYIVTHTVEEALQSLNEAKGSARLIGGGSDLLLDIQQGNCPPLRKLVDVTEVDELCALEIRGRVLFIGASVTLSRLKNSYLIKEHAQALADAVALMANPQVCNVATIGGNVAHALPAADGTIALLALDAQAEVANQAGRRTTTLDALFVGPGVSSLDPCSDLLVGFSLPLHEKGTASAFTRRMSPQGVALAILNMAIWLQRLGEQVAQIRIAAGPAGPVPLRMYASEKALLGQIPNPETLKCALDELLQEARFRTSAHRATSEYRRHLAKILLDEVFDLAWQRAG